MVSLKKTVALKKETPSTDNLVEDETVSDI